MKSVTERYPEEWEKNVSLSSTRAKRLETLRKSFVKQFPLTGIPKLKAEEYMVGFGKGSFCKRLEFDLNELGRIGGSQPTRYGVYYGKTKKDPLKKYRHAKGWGSTWQEAFQNAKKEIYKLLRESKKRDWVSVDRNRLSALFKGKLLFVYYPQQFVPIYADSHLDHFIAHLNLNGQFDTGPQKQRGLMAFKNADPVLKEYSVFLFTDFLYSVFGYPGKEKEVGSNSASKLTTVNLAEGIRGMEVLDKLPESSAINSSRAKSKKPDYEKRERNFRSIGIRGEALVLSLEQERLAGTVYRQCVDHVSLRDDRVGYDIRSFESNGTKKCIEVKATSRSDFGHGFFMSGNEVEVSELTENYWIYFVTDTMSENPKIFQWKCDESILEHFKPDVVSYRLEPKSIIV